MIPRRLRVGTQELKKVDLNQLLGCSTYKKHYTDDFVDYTRLNKKNHAYDDKRRQNPKKKVHITHGNKIQQ